MHLLPGPLVDRLPRGLWHVGNLYGTRFTGYHLHFCYADGGRRTVEWRSKELGRGRASREAEMRAHSDERGSG